MDQFSLLTSFAERRKHERLDRDFPLRYGLFKEVSDRAEKEGKLLDIGGGGLRFLATEIFALESQLIVEMKIPGWRLENDDWIQTRNINDVSFLNIVGNVMWSVPYAADNEWFETGLRFSGQIR